jgi:hypothetical protein
LNVTLWGDATSKQPRKRLWQDISTSLDFAIMVRFNQTQPSNVPLRTSRNQVLRLFTDNCIPTDSSEQSTEVNIKAGGLMEGTGFPTLSLPW